MTTATEAIGPIYCTKCRAKTDNKDAKRVRTKKGRGASEARCWTCDTRKFQLGGPAPTE